LLGSNRESMSRVEGIITRFSVIIFGLLAGAFATFIHFALPPVGLVVALAGSLACSLLVRSLTRSRLNIVFFSIAWLVVVYRGATLAGQELLIIANTPGYVLLYLGPVLTFVPVVLRVPKPIESDQYVLPEIVDSV